MNEWPNRGPIEAGQPPLSLGQRLFDRLAESRFLSFSILLHVVLVALCGGMIVAGHIRDRDFAPGGEFYQAVDETSEPPKDPTGGDETTLRKYVPNLPPVATETLKSILSATKLPTPFQAMEVVPRIAAGSSGEKPALPDLSRPTSGDGAKLPAGLAGRAGGKSRDAARMKMGGKEQSEKAVLAGLRWLKAHQDEAGSWGSEYRTAVTGLAVLCFLGHGETPESAEFGPTVKKGVDWLLAKGSKSAGDLAGGASNPGVYEHAIGTYALAEYFAMTQDDRVKEVLVQAVERIVQGQAPDGGWQYQFLKDPESDTSVSGWQIQALKAAHLSGLKIPGVEDALDRAMVNLRRVQGPNGGFGYRKAEDRYSLTGVGVLCTYFWKGNKDKSVRDGIRFILDQSNKEYPVEYKGAKADLYAWYYHTQACMMFGEPAWKKWNGLFQDQIANAQQPDGSWPPTGNPKPIGGLESRTDGSGPAYRTTLCVLMLEVFYRYAPPTP